MQENKFSFHLPHWKWNMSVYLMEFTEITFVWAKTDFDLFAFLLFRKYN